MNRSTARNYWLKRFNFQGRGDRCSLSRNCKEPSSFQYGWTFDRKVEGHTVPAITTRSACDHHARMFAFKHDLPFPRSAA
jgi:hypothetical protein